MAEIQIGFFLEDVGHEKFLTSLVARVAVENGLAREALRTKVWNATGGGGRVLDELKSFLRDVGAGRQSPWELLVIAIDGNCSSYADKRDEIADVVQASRYPGKALCAVPDPHIERWYLADPQGLRRALGARVAPALPPYKCERGVYKHALREAIRDAGVMAPLGGAEYGGEIAQSLDLYAAGKEDTSLKHFIGDLRDRSAPLAAGHNRDG